MKLAIMQPTFNPWLGYFDLIDYVDTLIFLDTVQLVKRSWQTRNKLKVNNQEYLFSIPIQKTKSRDQLLIKDSLFSNRNFQIKLLNLLKQNYKKAKYFDETNIFIESIVMFETEYLSRYTINFIQQIVDRLDLGTKIVVLSETTYNSKLSKGELILDICKYFEATEYISPLGSKEYLDKEANDFSKNNINISYQYYNHPIYTQLGKEFIPYIGIVDLLYNEGFENSKKIITSGRNYTRLEDENR